MEIRKDLLEISDLLQRLIVFSGVFNKNDTEDWPNLKNREDFNRVYALKDEHRYPLEKVYATGREIAGYLSMQLTLFNEPDLYPTLSSFIDSFKDGWLYEIDDLRKSTEKAKTISDELENCPWAVGRMIRLFNNQLDMFEPIKRSLDILRESELYKRENGEATMEKVKGGDTINISTVSGKVNVNSEDNSTNVSINVEGKVFGEIIEAIKSADIAENDKKALINEVSELKKSVGDDSFIPKYKNFLQTAANHMTILAPFIPALSQFLG